jgi:2-C-methyl-D-erythritol 4-phosphate cytidylyltransferase
VVALPPDLLARATDLLEDDREVVIVAGGDSRQDSVYNALGLVHSERVVVHDAARPLAGADLVTSVLEALADWDGAVAGVPLEDTLKKVEEGVVLGTVERAGLWKAQTPQAFRTRVLREAHDRARADGAVATDDAALLERIGKTVGIVPGKSSNLKITYPEDMLVAGALLRSERR